MRLLMTGSFLFRSLTALSIVVLGAGCTEMDTASTQTQPAAAPTPIPGYWHGDGVPGAAKIIVNITFQRAYFYKGKQLVGESTVSTGKKGFGTPPGHYQVLSKDKDHVSSVFGDYVDDAGNVVKSNIDSRKDPRPPGSHYDGARMPYAMFFRGGYAMHQGYVPPYAASHGCIRIPRDMADVFFNNTPVGTPVIVKESPSEYPRAEIYVRPVVPPPAPAPVLSSSQVPTVVRPPAPAPVLSSSQVRPVVRPPAPASALSSSQVRPVVRPPAPAPVLSSSQVRPVVRPPASAPTTVRAPAPSPSPSPTPARKKLPRRSS
ncbi:MAG: hypothetical protein QOH88_2392 [Verrucomicrobiota bacterium]